MSETISRQLECLLTAQKEWSLATFGPGRRTLGLLAHIRKELAEIEQNPDDPMEWVDVAILALDGAWRTGCSIPYIVRNFERTGNEIDFDIDTFLVALERLPMPLVRDWTQIVRCAIGQLWQQNYNALEILTMIEAKQEINRNRTWPPPPLPEDQPTEHIREEER